MQYLILSATIFHGNSLVERLFILQYHIDTVLAKGGSADFTYFPK